MIKAQVRTAQKTPGNNQKILENIRLPRLRKFRITSFSWNSPRLKISATAELAHRSFENLDLPMRLNSSVDVSEKSIEANASFSATPKGPGLENAGFGLSVSQEDNLALLNASATAEGRMPEKDNLYVVDLSHYMKGVGRKRLQKLENMEFPKGFHVTFQLEVSEGLSVENQPSAPSYCKTGKCRTYVWENQDAVTATTSLLSGESSFVIKSVLEEESQTAFPYVYVALGIVAAVAAASVAYRKRRSSQKEEK
ncbi:hypothetical protein AKJ39_01305 [candidate division MSBL1 archaeon SCGC-AAA259J03]|uniref:Uncharacterized protein n=1 Tax=candidate division MSBL1 archaeon SCGC-AAA259J03 TaxID=1698269 RepID=A0A656YXH0_9EURY|nr:hypothetical protein AKJ39_01305 [candidate division MSBL1 archaeon SCGC-AAA259J03]